MRIKGIITGAAGIALLGAATATSAAPNPAASLSLSRAGAVSARTGSQVHATEKLAEGKTATLISIGILAALVVIVLVATNGNNNDDGVPDSA